MNLEIKMDYKDKKIYIALILIFILSVICRFIFAIKCGEITVFYDELLHWKISQAIASEGQVIFRNYNLGYNEVLYPLVIAVTHLITDDVEMSYILAKLINCILMSSAIFPIYLMSVKILNNRSLALVIGIVGIIIPEMAFTMKIMQENLYYPMFMWFWYTLIRMLVDDKFNNKNVILFSIYIFIMTVCKQMALNVFVGIILYYIITIICEKEHRKSNIIQIILFLVTFLLMKIVYFNLFHIINSTYEVSSNSSISVILHNIFKLTLLIKLVYPALTYILMIIIAFGIFTIIVPISLFSKLNRIEKKLLIIILAIIFSTIAVICLRIVPAENLGDTTIRIHLRYIYYMFMPLLILFFSCKDKLEKFGLTKFGIVLIMNFIVMVILLNVLPMGGATVDGISIYILCQIGNEDVVKISIKILIIIVTIAISYILYNKKIRIFYYSIISLLIFGMLINTLNIYKIENASKKSLSETKNEAFIINNYLKENKNQVLIISDGEVSQADLEACLSVPYYITLKDDFYNNISSTGKIEFEKLKLQSFHKTFSEINLKIPYYIISKRPLKISGYDLVNINLNKYNLYRRSGDNVAMKYTIDGIYEDNWMGKESTIEVYDNNDKSEINLELKMNTPVLNENIITYQDSAGNSQNLVIKKNQDIYIIKLQKNSNNKPFMLKLVADKTFNPEGPDERNLSVRILDIKIK